MSPSNLRMRNHSVPLALVGRSARPHAICGRERAGEEVADLRVAAVGEAGEEARQVRQHGPAELIRLPVRVSVGRTVVEPHLRNAGGAGNEGEASGICGDVDDRPFQNGAAAVAVSDGPFRRGVAEPEKRSHCV